MLFRDDWERKAHEIICIVKYGGIGGQVRETEMREVANVLRGHSLKPALAFPKVVLAPTLPDNVALVIPKINGLPVLTGHDPTKAVGKLELGTILDIPVIKLP